MGKKNKVSRILKTMGVWAVTGALINFIKDPFFKSIIVSMLVAGTFEIAFSSCE